MIDNKTKIVQEKSLVILKEIKRVCQKNNIEYSLACGTLLGAIRHKGFIPWDDDVDIYMTLPNYKKFLKIAKQELGSEFFLQTYKTDPNYYLSFAKVRMNNTTFIPYGSEKHHIHQGIWVDIFPIISIPNKTILRRVNRVLFNLAGSIQSYDYLKQNKDLYSSTDKNTNKKVRISFLISKIFSFFPNRFQVFIHSALLSLIFKNPKGNKELGEVWVDILHIKPKYFDKEFIDCKFEDEFFSITGYYEEYLSYKYGDYLMLPPENERTTHGAFIVDGNKSFSSYMG